MLLAAAICCGARRRCANPDLRKRGPLSDFKPRTRNGGRGWPDAGAAVARERASSIVGPSPSATLVKASESLSFTAADGVSAAAAAVDPAGAAGSMALLSSLSHPGPPSSDVAASADLGGGRPPWPASGDLGTHSMASTLAASAAPRSVPGSAGGLTGVASVDAASSSIASLGVPASAEHRPGAANGGSFGSDELKIFDVLYRSRDSAVYQGARWPPPARLC